MSKKQKKYSSEFKIRVIMDMLENRLGYHRITMVMRNNGYEVNHKTVQKLMNSLGLKGKQSKNGKYHSYKGEVGKVADNLLHRDFHAEKPFEKPTTDIT